MSPEVRYRCNYAMYFVFIGATTQGLGQGGADPLFPSTPVAKKRNARSVNGVLIPRVQSVTDVIRVVIPEVEKKKMCWHCVTCSLSLLSFKKSPKSMGRGHAYTFPICTFPNKQKEANNKSWRD
jgi:predicted nucleotide-binding protein (sugar kinase/HSP70/actin superfamily)